MSNCCVTSKPEESAGKFFSRMSRRYAKRFRKGGLERSQQYLLEGIRKEPIAAKELLDIGCGVGSLHMTLLQEGARRAMGVDVSEGMIRQAEALAKELHLAEKTEYRLGDFVEQAGEIREADVTMLDKVVCCYENHESLIAASAAKTRSIYALSYPNDNILVEAVFRIQIFFAQLFRFAFHPFWHDWNEIHHSILAKGFQRIYSNSTFVWQVSVYRRV